MSIVVFPMLCSSTLSHQVLPAVAKTVEQYLIIHRLNEILEETQRNVSSARKVKGRIQLKEDESISGGLGEGFIVLDEAQPGTKTSGKTGNDETDKNKSNKDKEKELRKKRKEDRKKETDAKTKEEKEKKKQKSNKQKEEELKQKSKSATVSGVSIPHKRTHNLEPTWMEVDRIVDGQQFKDIIGVKVMPYRVNAKEDVSLITLLTNDRNLRGIEKSIVSLGRKFKKTLFKMYDEVKSKTIGKITSSGEPVKGDPRHDVIMARTSFKQNVFVCADATELDDEFFDNIGGVKSMFGLGWPSIIAVDEVNKSASFCMQGYQGMCYDVSFSRMFRTLSDSEGKVYDDMESVKKSSGGLFRQKTKPSKVFGENFAYGILDDYKSNLNEDKKNLNKNEYIDESVKEILTEGKIRDAWNYMSKVASIGKVLKSGNIESAMSKFKGRGNINKIIENGKQINPKFDECYKVAKRKIDKFAPNVNEKIRESFSASVAIASGTETDRPVKYAENLSDGSVKAINRWYNNLKRKQQIPGEKSDAVIGGIIFSLTILLVVSFSGALIYAVIRGAMILSGGPDVPGIEDFSSTTGGADKLATKSTMPGTPDTPSGGKGTKGVPDIPPKSGASLSMGPAAILINLANNPDSSEAVKAASEQVKESGGILSGIKNIMDVLGAIIMLAWDAGATIINIISTIFGALISLTEHLLTLKGMKSLSQDPSIIFDIFRYRDVIPTFYL